MLLTAIKIKFTVILIFIKLNGIVDFIAIGKLH